MMKWVWIGVATVVVLTAAAFLNGFLAPLKIHHEITAATKFSDPSNQATETPEPFVGLALSGGGARAALFAASGMRALDARGLLEDVTHVSSVSGGGFTASYFALYPPTVCDGDTYPATCKAAYFDEMERVLARDYFWDVEVNQVTHPPRILSPSRRLTSLQEALDRDDFLKDAKFSALPTDRTFFFNAVSYDTGKRFIFSNGVLPSAESTNTRLPPALRALSFSDGATMRTAPAEMPVSLAVATSAAFPPYLGPTTIAIKDSYGKPVAFWHLGDGGVLENSGVETLREAVYAETPPGTAVIYEFNAGQRLDQDLSRNTHDISIWSRDVARVVDVLLEYSGDQR